MVPYEQTTNAQDERRRSNNHNKNKQIILLSHLKAETCLLDNTVQEILIILISISALLSFAHSHALGEITKRYQKANLDKNEASPEFIFPCFCLRSGGQSKPFASTTSQYTVLSFSISMAAALVWTYWDPFLASSSKSL